MIRAPRVLEEFVAIDELDEAVVVYGTRICGFCIRATHLLSSEDIDFCFVNVLGQSDARAWLQQKSGQSTVPQVFIHKKSVGGYQELSGLHHSGELQSLLATPSAKP